MQVRLNTWHYIGDKLYAPESVLGEAEMGDASVSLEMEPLDAEALEAIRVYKKKKGIGEEFLPKEPQMRPDIARPPPPLMGPVRPAPPKLKDKLPGA